MGQLRERCRWIGFVVAMILSCDVVFAQNVDPDGQSPRSRALDLDDDPQRGGGRGNREILQMLDQAKQAAEKKQYHTVVQLLQSVLENDEDFFFDDSSGNDGENQPAVPAGDENVVHGGIKARALMMLSQLPAEGLKTYELNYGTKAADELADARELGDVKRLVEVARRFSMTKAGFDAVVLLAARAADTNRPLEAALQLEGLRSHPAASEKRTPQLLLKQATCWHRAGRIELCRKTLVEMKSLISAKSKSEGVAPKDKKSADALSMKIGGRSVPLFTRDIDASNWLSGLLGRGSVSSTQLTEMWAMPGGGPTRNESAAMASTIGGDQWKVSLFEHIGFDRRPEQAPPRRKLLEQIHANETASLNDEHRMAFPVAQPIVIGDAVVYRTLSDVTAVSLSTGELLWRSALSDETLVRLWNNHPYETRNSNRSTGQSLESSLAAHVRRRSFRDAAAGTLTSDGRSVFALEDIDSTMPVGTAFRPQVENNPSNKLVAYDAAGGRILWEIGGPRGAKPAEFSGHFFLGPPLPLDGRLYCLAESVGDVKLMVLEQNDDRTGVTLEWSQTIYSVGRSVHFHPPRRLSGLSPTYSDGVLVCPTSSGAVIAVDLVKRMLLWGRPYQPSVPDEPLNQRMFLQQANSLIQSADNIDEQSRWLNGLAMIADGRVILTPRDDDDLFCLDLLDGHLAWKLPRGDWLYPACVFEGRLIMVGRDGLGAFRLNDGTPEQEFVSSSLEPSGFGVRVGTQYVLPLSNGEVATIELSSGRVLSRSALSGGRIAGNLAAGSGVIVSQSGTELVAFSRYSSIEQKIATGLATDPPDASALALRGELHLQQGREEAGLADLRQSLKLKPDARVKTVLASTLLGSLRVNKGLIRERAEELDNLTVDPRQRSEFLRMYARSLEEAGDKTGAFAQLLRLADTVSRVGSELEWIAPGHAVNTERAVRSKVIALYLASDEVDRKKCDEALSKFLSTPQEGVSHEEKTVRMLRLFAGIPGVERSLFEKLPLVEGTVLPHSVLVRFADAIDVDVAAKANSLLVDSLLKADQPGAALPWIDRLNATAANRKVLGEETGRSLSAKWREREDVQKLLEFRSPWSPGPIDVTRVAKVNPGARQTESSIEIVSRSESPFSGWRFEMDTATRQMTARDAECSVKWSVVVPEDAGLPNVNERIPASIGQIHLRDRWLVLVLPGYFVVFESADPMEAPRLAWQQPMRSSSMVARNDAMARRALAARAIPGNRGVIFSPDGTRNAGQFVGISREVAVFSVGNKLSAVELDTGRPAWNRHDVLPNLSFATVDDHAIAIQGNGLREVTLLNPLDGSELRPKSVKIDDAPIWMRGSKVLVQRVAATGRILEMKDILRDEVVWTKTVVTNSLITSVNEDDIAVLEQVDKESNLTLIRRADGIERYHVRLAYPANELIATRLIIQRDRDRDTILVGTPSKQIGNVRVFPVDFTASGSTPIDGLLASVDRREGKIVWSHSIEQACVVRQSVEQLPVLLLAVRLYDPAGAVGNPFSSGQQRLFARVIDKRSGRTIYSTNEVAIFSSNAPIRMVPQSDTRQITAEFNDWQLKLAFGMVGNAGQTERKPE